jgi:hypothetical protein
MVTHDNLTLTIWTPIHVITNDVMTNIVQVLIFKKTYNLEYFIFYNFDYPYG